MSKMSKLRDVSINPTSVENLNLSKSEDLICKNLMCEKLGEVCICKLARWASINGPSLDNLQALELENNGLTVLPDSVFDLNQIDWDGDGVTTCDGDCRDDDTRFVLDNCPN